MNRDNTTEEINGLVVMICEHCNHKIVTMVQDNKMLCPYCKKEGKAYRGV